MEPQSDEVGAFVPAPRALLAAESDSLLNGLRHAVKDLIDIVGYPTMCGNPDWTVSHFALVAPAPMGTAILRAMAQLVSKAKTIKSALPLFRENDWRGTPRHPRTPGRLAGGSRCGFAAGRPRLAPMLAAPLLAAC